MNRPLCPHCFRGHCPWLTAAKQGPTLPDPSTCPHFGARVPPVARERLRAALARGTQRPGFRTDILLRYLVRAQDPYDRTAARIIEETKTDPSTAYETLRKLIERGLASRRRAENHPDGSRKGGSKPYLFSITKAGRLYLENDT